MKVEIEKKERIVIENAGFLVVCPWWAVWPFEVMVVSKKHRRALVDLSVEERSDFAEAVAEVTRRYDNLFETSFPYSEFSSKPFGERGVDHTRFWNPPSTARGYGRGDQCVTFPHAFLPASATQCNG